MLKKLAFWVDHRQKNQNAILPPASSKFPTSVANIYQNGIKPPPFKGKKRIFFSLLLNLLPQKEQ